MNTPAAFVTLFELVDGIDQLPSVPGIYAMFNRKTRLINIGQAMNIKRRCSSHRSTLKAGTSANMRMRRDAEIHGADDYHYYVLEVLVVEENARLKRDLDLREIWWVTQLQAHDETIGYVSEAGHNRTPGARLREREWKLMRANSRKYQLLPWVNMYDPISPALLDKWIPGG